MRWAEWTEIDRDEGVWTVPARRMKANREHRVPLCGRAVEILDEARTLVEGTSPFLFPNRVGKQLEEKQLRRMFPEARDRGRATRFSLKLPGTGRPRRRIIPARSSKRLSRMWYRTGSRRPTGAQTCSSADASSWTTGQPT